MIKRICVFCGSSSGARAEYAQAAKALAKYLVAKNITIVYGGGHVGLMGILSGNARTAGGEVIGVIPHGLVAKEVADMQVKDLRIVDSMHERKAIMADLSDAFIAMPGGYGTFEEFCEIVTWAQLGLHRKPCGLLNVEGYYDPLLALFDHAVSEGFLRPANRLLVIQESDPGRLLENLSSYTLPVTEKWISRNDS